ncbi:MAG: hypothetical protein QXI11_07405, partial [Thermoproteota archaeon]
MGLKKFTGLLLILLILVFESRDTVLTIVSHSQTGYCPTFSSADDRELRRQLEDSLMHDNLLLERGYAVPLGMNLSFADAIWLALAPLISLGYGEEEIVEEVRRKKLPEEVNVNGVAIMLDYANLRVVRNLENGGVFVDIPVVCNSPLTWVHYEVKSVRKRVKLYNVTSIKYYNVSLNAYELYNVTYSIGEKGFSKALLKLDGGPENTMVKVYLPGLDDPVFSEISFHLPPYGIMLSLKALERKAYKAKLAGGGADYYWIRVNQTLRAANNVSRVVISICHGGGRVIGLWPILPRGEYASEHWVKWVEGEKLTLELSIGRFKSTFILSPGNASDGGRETLNWTLSEGELESLLGKSSFRKLDSSKSPEGWRIRLAGEKVVNETVWVTEGEYESLARRGWRRGSSIFIDSGESEWDYTVSNRTLSGCRSIRLFYNPLVVNGGGLVHGLTIRNYANTSISYGLRLRTTTNRFLFFSKVDEGTGEIAVNSTSASQILLIQQEPAVGDAVLELVKDNRVVATVKVYLALKATAYWKGFWNGLASKLPGIIVTAGVMVVIGFLVPKAYFKPLYYVLLGLGVVMNLAEIAIDVVEAQKAREEMLALAEAFEKRAGEFLARGEVEHAVESMGFAFSLRREVNETMSSLMLNVISDLAIGVSPDEIRIALGLKEPVANSEFERQYKIGYARGRVVGAVVSCALYVTLMMMVNRVKAERIGQRLTASQILRMVARGIYNWITPSVWDAVCLAIRGKGVEFLVKVTDLLLGNKYSGRFGEAIGSLVDGAGADPPGVEYVLEASSTLSKQVLENVPSRESSRKILDVLGLIIEQYSKSDLSEKGSRVAKTLVSLWASCGDGAVECIETIFQKSSKAGEAVLEWLGLGEGSSLRSIERLIPKITGLSTSELEDVGRALAKVSDSFENGLRFFETYFRILGDYSVFGIGVGGKVSKAFLENVEEDCVKALEAWELALEYLDDGILAVPASIKSISIGGEAREYPALLKGLAESVELGSEDNIVTVIISKKGETYRILGELSEPKTIGDGSTVQLVLPQDVLRREGRFTSIFSFSRGDYVIVLKGAVEPDFFFVTEKSEGEKVKVKLTSIWGEEFIKAHGFGEYFVYYRRMDEKSIHHALKGFEEEGGLGKYITLTSHGEGIYVLRVKPVSWDMFSGIMESVKRKLKIPFSYGPDPSTGKGRITIEVEDASTGVLRKTLASGVYEYAPYLRVEGIEGGLKWDIPLGEAGGQVKALRIGVAVDDSGKLYYDVEYSPDYDPENLGGIHLFPVEGVVYVNKPFGMVMEIHHEGGTRHLLYDPATGLFKGEFIGPRDKEYEALSKYIESTLSGVKIPKPSYDVKGKVWRITIETGEEFREAWAYGGSLLSNHGKGTLATEIVRDF